MEMLWGQSCHAVACVFSGLAYLDVYFRRLKPFGSFCQPIHASVLSNADTSVTAAYRQWRMHAWIWHHVMNHLHSAWKHGTDQWQRCA